MRLGRLLSGAVMIGAVTGWSSAAAQAVLSGFQGSTEKGVYEAEFDALTWPTTLQRDSPVDRVEGQLRSRVFVKPVGRTNLELFRSYERELEAAGFKTMLSATPSPATQSRIWEMYRASDARITGRTYRATDGRVQSGDLARLERFIDYYLVARQERPDRTLHVVILISREQNLYLIDELTASPMQAGTVAISLDAMRTAIEETGKVAIYDVHFATGSDVIEATSADALRVIASYLSSAPGRFYIVGHTDDTGTLAANLALSERRAAAVKAALVADHGVAAARLETRGVGPLAPVATNVDDGGRAKNRRVEVVRRLP